MYRWIDNSVHLNVNDMFDAALRNTRIEMSPAERRQFYEKHIRHMTLTIDENGNVSIELKRTSTLSLSGSFVNSSLFPKA